MSQQVRIIITMSLVAVASGAVAAGITTSVTDSAGNTQNVATAASTFPSPDSDGNFTVEADFEGVATGLFSGTVTAQTATGETVGTPVSFSGTATNLQPVPVSVTVAFA
jgi:hypothetical protein